jgi:hypothetical protein
MTATQRTLFCTAAFPKQDIFKDFRATATKLYQSPSST